MAAVMTPLVPKPGDVTFDGNPIDLERVLAHVALRFITHAGQFSTDRERSAYLASHFRGSALDWVSLQLTGQQTVTYLDDYEGFVNRVKNAFFFSLDHAQAQAQNELGALKQTGDLLEFLERFEFLTVRAGTVSDTSRLTLLFPKLNARYHEALLGGGNAYVSYTVARTKLLNIYDRTPLKSTMPDQQRKKARCKKCGKRGHTGSQCSVGN